MRFNKRILPLVLMLIGISIAPAVVASTFGGGGKLRSIEITALPASIEMGEPLVLKITLSYEEPQIHAETKNVGRVVDPPFFE